MINVRSLGKKAGFVVAVAGAAVVGGVTTALVTAAIPSSNDGQIHACYLNNQNATDEAGRLRVIDSEESQTCSSEETSLAWAQGTPKVAYARINYDEPSNTYTLDTNRSTGVDSLQVLDDGYGNIFALCIHTDMTPKSVLTAVDSGGAYDNEIKDENGWTGNPQCEQVTNSNILITPTNSSFYMLVNGKQ